MCHQPNKNKHNGDGDMIIQGKLMEKPLLRKPFQWSKSIISREVITISGKTLQRKHSTMQEPLNSSTIWNASMDDTPVIIVKTSNWLQEPFGDLFTVAATTTTCTRCLQSSCWINVLIFDLMGWSIFDLNWIS